MLLWKHGTFFRATLSSRHINSVVSPFFYRVSLTNRVLTGMAEVGG